MFASHHKLDNLNIIIDNNQTSMLGRTNTIVSHNNLKEKLIAFGWDCYDEDGHDTNKLQSILLDLKSYKNNKPKALIANTIKGNGVPSLEKSSICHVLGVSEEEMLNLLKDDK